MKAYYLNNVIYRESPNTMFRPARNCRWKDYAAKILLLARETRSGRAHQTSTIAEVVWCSSMHWTLKPQLWKTCAPSQERAFIQSTDPTPLPYARVSAALLWTFTPNRRHCQKLQQLHLYITSWTSTDSVNVFSTPTLFKRIILRQNYKLTICHRWIQFTILDYINIFRPFL